MLRLLCVAFVLAVAVDTVFGALNAAQRGDVNKAVIDARVAAGKSQVGQGGNDEYLEANGLAEVCSVSGVKELDGGAVSVGGDDENQAALDAANELAEQSPADADHVSCDAMTCPDTGAFVACSFTAKK